ncbi:hypothetical protein UA08_08620 [Talaromyces atroroseus]|uniref:Xaa-Pro aminopeptidase n=1 Tax=Talaromyces atroroseus TaxID=1441469 RepID=A0A225A635_TALAT|nr:hypothetical protein UA08_08620 [Talaromyces atroroseus]OKL55941.1 hypothetical protein UA08_08620 [Talaromyces atroroseus]
MNSLAIERYGKPEEYNNLSLPIPRVTAPDDVLIQVQAASINPVDVQLAAGTMKMIWSEQFPYKIGYDLSGTVVSVGSEVLSSRPELKIGAKVYSRVPQHHRGTASEFALSSASATALKPSSLSYIEAASLPLVSLTALQALDRADKHIEGGLKGKTVYIPGALSGTGSVATQLAKNVFGAAKVITTASPSKIPKVEEKLGKVVNQIIDYTKEDPGKIITAGSVDFMFNTMDSAMASLHLMKKGGIIVSVSGAPFGSALKGKALGIPIAFRWLLDGASAFSRYRARRCGVKYVFQFMNPNAEDLNRLTNWVGEGRLRPVVGRAASLGNIQDVREGCQEVLAGKGGIGNTQTPNLLSPTGYQGLTIMGTSQPLSAPAEGSDMLDFDQYHINLTITGTKINKYPAKQHARKVASKLGASRGLIYLTGKPTVFHDDSDQAEPFRQRRYFYYLSGANEPDCHLTYDIAKDKLTLYVPDFDLRQAVWMGPTVSIEDALEKFDVDNARYAMSLPDDISTWLRLRKDDAQIIILHPEHRPPIDCAQELLETQRLLPAMNSSRGVKDAHEIELIRQANVVSGLAHTAILENIGQMTNESDIAALFLKTSITHGAPEQAYGIIAASGENIATLHYMKNNEDFGDRPLVCLDAGAEFECYASDVTRTFPISCTGEWPTPEARDIYLAVERMQEETIRLVKPGVRFRDVHTHAALVAVEELLKLGVFKKGSSVSEIMLSGAVSVFFPHGLGHHVGLEVHDVSEHSVMASGLNPRNRGSFLMQSSDAMSAAALLEENMIVTVEPGIYFNRLALKNARQLPISKFIDFDVVEKYYAVGGVRIEDDILVTADGYENLTTAPKGQEALDIVRRSSAQNGS